MSSAQQIFFYNGPNSDDDLRAIAEGWYRSAIHLRSGTIEAANQFSRESYLGNALLSNPTMPAGTNRVLGMFPNIESQSIMMLSFNSNGNHNIWSLSINTGTFTKVVQSSALNFLITDYVYHGFVNNGIAYWTVGRLTSFLLDNFSEPKQVDIAQATLLTAGLPSAYTAFTRRVFDFVKWPPPFGPDASYGTDLNQSGNFLYGKMYKFRYEYLYLNNEVSATSPITRLPLPTLSEFTTGRDVQNTQADNILNVVINTGPDIVTKINVLVSVNDGPWFIYDQINKSLQGLANNAVYTSVFRGNEALIPVGAVLRNYDNVPLVARGMEMLPCRQIAFGDYIEGFNKEAITATISAIAVELTGRKPFVCSTGAYFQTGIHSTLRVPAILFSALNVQEGDVYVYSVYEQANYPTFQTISYTITRADYDAIQGAMNPENQLITILAAFISATYGATGAFSGPSYVWTSPIPVFVAVAAGINPFSNGTILTPYRRTYPKAGLFKGITHEFAIQYYDRANRDGTVWTSPSLKLKVPFDTEQDKTDFQDPNNPFYTVARWVNGAIPPTWATHYQIVWRRVPVPAQQERTLIQFATDLAEPLMFKLSLDNYFNNSLYGSYNQNIQIGNSVRFIRQQASPTANGDYAPGYTETTVLKYSANGGLNGTEAIWIPRFDNQPVLGPNNYNGAVIQIYTPGKLDENAPWREIGEEYTVIGANTVNRRHQGSDLTGTATDLVNGSNQFSLASWLVGPNGGNFEYLVGRVFAITADVLYIGTITAASFNPATHITTITANANFTGAQSFGSIVIDLNQILSGPGVSLLPAINNIQFGDVYTLIRQMAVYTGPGPVVAQFFTIDDFYYSGYYVSNFNSVGRLAKENNEARQVRQRATIEHGGSFVDNTLQNNLCLFDPSDLNAVLAMDEQYGPINKMIMMDGYTLKCIQDRKENSVYIKATFGVLPGGSTQTGFTPSSQTFGGWNPSGSLYGTLHPLSVQVIQNRLYYYDHLSGTVVRSSNNGQDDICETKKYKYQKRINDFKLGVEAIGLTNAWISSIYDEQNDEYQLTLFNTAAPTVGVQGLVFKPEKDRWDHEVKYAVFFGENLGTYLVSSPALLATVYRHGTGNQNTFYGTQYASELYFPWNDDPLLIKRPLRIGLRTNRKWALVSFVTEGDESYAAQDTEVLATQWDLLEGYYWADFLNDKNNVVPEIPSLATTQLALINGRELRAYGAIGRLTYTPTGNNAVKIFSLTILSQPSDPAI